MLRHFFVFVIFSLFLTPAFAQTQADSVNNHPLVDTIAKHTLADSLIKHSPDSVVKRSGRKRKKIKHPVIDSTSNNSAVDSVAKRALIDSTSKHIAVDSVAKHPLIDSAAKILPIDNSKKKLPVKAPDKAPPSMTTIAIKHSPIKTLSDEKYNTL